MSSPSSSFSSTASRSTLSYNNNYNGTSSSQPFLDPLQRAQLALENARLIRQQAVDANSYRIRIEKNIGLEQQELEGAKHALDMVKREYEMLEKEKYQHRQEIQQSRQRLLQLLYCIKDLLLVIDNEWDGGDLSILNNPQLLSAKQLMRDPNLPPFIQQQLLTFSNLFENNKKKNTTTDTNNVSSSSLSSSATTKTKTTSIINSLSNTSFNGTETITPPTDDDDDEYIPPSMDMIRITYQILAEKLALWFVRHPDIL